MELPEFQRWNSIKRLFREITVSEKIDGTCGVIHVSDDFSTIIAGSREQWITPEKDNHGFARWVNEHREELIKGLGPGYHYGEWWGAGIQRRYGLKEKRFSLFNTNRWGPTRDQQKYPTEKPDCCHVVPVLYQGIFNQDIIQLRLGQLKEHGSIAAPGFLDIEGICIFHEASQQLYKYTLPNDGHKGGKK